MLVYKFSTRRAVRTKSIDFGLLSDDEVRKMSVVEVSNLSIYHRGVPQADAVNDIRMGTIDRRILCGSCGMDVKSCPGHCGHIECGAPLFHISFIENTMRCLRSVCYHCSKLLVSEAECKIIARDIPPGKLLFNAVYSSARTKKKCPYCECPQPSYNRSNTCGIKIEWSNDTDWSSEEEKKEVMERIWSSVEASSILSHISDEDVKLMGMDPARSHPRHCVRATVLVPPPISRPAIMQSTGSRVRGQDDITHTLQNVLKRSIELKSLTKSMDWRITSPMTEAVLDKILKLQIEVFSLVNNSVRGQRQSVQRSGAPVKSITCRLKGKEGRIRGNLMGKRVDFSARSVITPDAITDVDEVGVPHAVAMELTMPVRVTSMNIAELRERVLIGAKDVRGASTVINADGQVTHLEFCEDRRSIRLQPGWVVERFMQDNDWVIFNRQPSLWKFGMMAHRARLVPGMTFRLNLCCAGPYNADFDGDEMNMHLVQSQLGAAEVRSLMAVPLQTLSPQANRPVIGIVQDTLLGTSLLTRPGVFLTRREFFKFVIWIRYPNKDIYTLPPPAIAYPVELYTGAQLFSMLLPPGVTVLKGKASLGNELPEAGTVLIRSGELLYGSLSKALLGTASNGIIDVLARDFGSQITIRFMSDIQRVVNQWLMTQGFSVKVSDCVMSAEGHAKVAECVANATENASAIVEADLPESLMPVAEGTVVNILSKLLMQTGAIARQYTDPDNSITTMVDVGAKGNSINTSQISGCVGQQSVEGRRIFSDGGVRTLNCFSKNDRRLVTNGFVMNSYSLGLQPEEFFFHSMGGREGLVDTAVKTAVTGYIQRRLVKMMEDFKVCYRGTVRASQNRIVEFSYGGDGADASRLEKVQLPVITMGAAEIRRLVCSEITSAVEEGEFASVLQLVTRVRAARLGGTVRYLDNMALLPFSPRRLLQRVSNTAKEDPLDAANVYMQIRELVEEMLTGASPRVNTALAVQFCMCSKRLQQAAVGQSAFNDMFKIMQTRCRECLVDPGEMVGTLAAQSIGEPCTQMSTAHSTQVLVAIDGKMKSVSIGEIIDAYLPPIRSNDQHNVVPVSNLKCPGVSPTETVVWANVTHVSRHPANGDMVTVKTERGRTVKATASHSFLVREKNRVVQRTGADLVLGDCLPIVMKLPSSAGVLPWSPIPLTRATGRFIGAIVSEGTINKYQMSFVNTEHQWLIDIIESFANDTGLNAVHKNSTSTGGLGSLPMLNGSVSNKELADWMAEHFGRTSFNKTLPAWILDAPDEFVTGLLQTYFDGDGNVQTEARHHRLCCHSVSTELVTMLCLCLARYGIVSYVGTESYKTPAGEPGTSHRITIPMCFAAKFQEHIGFSIECKADKLARVVKEQEAVGMRGFQAHIPGMNEVLEEVRSYIPPGGDKNSFETLLRKTGITSKMLMRCRENAINAPEELVAELDQAINADVWWDPIVSIEIMKDSKEMVYDFTVDERLQSFMLSNGVFVHNTLNTFHYSGVASKNNTVVGIPRLKEVLDCTKKCKTPANILYLKAPFNQSEEFAGAFARTLTSTKLGTLVKRTEIVYDPDPRNSVIEEDRIFVQLDSYFTETVPGAARWVGRLTLNKDEMQARDLTPPILCEHLSLRLEGKAHCCSSEANALEWVVRIRLMDVASMSEHGFGPETRDDIEQTLVQRITATLLEQVQAFGHVGVKSAREKAIEVWDGTKNETVYTVETLGTVLADVALIPVVQWEQSSTNDIHEALDVLGIEACAYVTLQEITNVISFDGTYVDRRHLLEVTNAMTCTGELKPVSRHGLNRPGPCGTCAGPMMKCSFEETSDVLTDAALFSESDDASGVTSSVMNGERALIGTGCFDVIMPTWSLPSEKVSSNAQNKLAKSKVRTNVVADERRTVEFMDDTLWSFRNDSRRSEMEAPFCDAPGEVAAVGSACYAEPPTPLSSRVFEPTSPKLINF